jgi:hypothetical protein
VRRVQLSSAAVAVALVPAALGLWGNASFSADVPVRVPDRVSSHGPGTTAAPSTGSRVGEDHGDHASGHGGRHGTDDPAVDDSTARGGRGGSGGHGADD